MQRDSFFQKHPKITRSLKKFIHEYEEKLAPETFAAFLESLSEELTRASEDFAAVPPGPARARKLHELVEQEIAQGAEIEISCKKGCSACCHMEVEITSYEAEILATLVTEGHVIDRGRLQKQSERSLQDGQWKQGIRNLESKCVFLNSEGACSIYEHRPVMCRRHSVTSPAKNCETLDAPITLRYFPRVDLLISAANEDSEMQIGPLAKMLQMKVQA
ncbi:YkgJ family cysteine cluster protein [Bdellovibrio svalbardensis]|uniref:YkgJ family cysteine cluster protein n=1 Tax=Bdellovibrio svalbardensis TaxID=2972972 RepID=A0ABT6DMU2_9BACT|nr:YkgJ family cysteine cluster protein [Bdellovibrio svalbardensis]MDG0818098.1 YkgJ family cysteine cluster protein [Bdellovibrio svalbardensis]